MRQTERMIAAAGQAFSDVLRAATGGKPSVTMNPTTLHGSLTPPSDDFPHVGRMPGASTEMKEAYRTEVKRRRKRR